MIPWQVSLQRFVPKKGFLHYCGGTILNAYTILSAANCNIKVGHKVLAGSRNRKKGTRHVIKKVITNRFKPYDKYDYIHDIVILKLKTPLALDDTRQPACLPSKNFKPKVGSICYVSGWGVKNYGGNYLPKWLQYVSVPIVDHASCANTLYGIESTDSLICAGADGKDACSKDSGTPLVCIENGKPVITGITSFGVDCGDPDYPGVYTEVVDYRRWIQAAMKRHPLWSE